MNHVFFAFSVESLSCPLRLLLKISGRFPEGFGCPPFYFLVCPVTGHMFTNHTIP